MFVVILELGQKSPAASATRGLALPHPSRWLAVTLEAHVAHTLFQHLHKLPHEFKCPSPTVSNPDVLGLVS